MTAKVEVDFSALSEPHCVKETARGLVFPRNFPCRRGIVRKMAIIVTFISLILIASFLANGSQVLFILSSLSTIFTILSGMEIFCRVYAMIEECRYLRSRYDGSVQYLLYNAFKMTTLTLMVTLGSIFSFTLIYFITHKTPFDVVLDGNRFSVLLVFSSMLPIQKTLKLEQSPLNESLQFEELQGCDYGSGMAHSYFHGFLRIMLPHTGRGNDKGLKEFQEDYEARHNELECKEIDRAGVKKRNYKHSVYKIRSKSGNIKYVTAEYATPVQTLADVMKGSTSHARMYMKHRKEILLNFYLTLRSLLREDAECCDLCEVIYYDDKNEKGEFRDVGYLILDRQEEILNNCD